MTFIDDFLTHWWTVESNSMAITFLNPSNFSMFCAAVKFMTKIGNRTWLQVLGPPDLDYLSETTRAQVQLQNGSVWESRCLAHPDRSQTNSSSLDTGELNLKIRLKPHSWRRWNQIRVEFLDTVCATFCLFQSDFKLFLTPLATSTPHWCHGQSMVSLPALLQILNSSVSDAVWCGGRDLHRN